MLIRSSESRKSKYRAVKIETIDALEAWCPPTFMPSRLGLSLLAKSIIRVESHKTRS